MIYEANKGQTNYGEAVGILMLDTFVPFVPGDIGNASSFSFPVRYETVHGLDFNKLTEEPEAALPMLIEAGKTLESAGVRAVTADCGFMILYQQKLAEALSIPVFSSSLLQLAFMEKLMAADRKIGIITAESSKLNDSVLNAAGADRRRIAVKGMENKSSFAQSVLQETGKLDSGQVKKEAVEAAVELLEEEPATGALLLECSMLSPYAKAVQETVKMPVFDYVTMVEFVHNSLVKKEYDGFM